MIQYALGPDYGMEGMVVGLGLLLASALIMWWLASAAEETEDE